MPPALRLLFYPKTRHYEVVSPEGYKLRLTESEFNSIKGQMNGIALAFADQARERRKNTGPGEPISSSFSARQSLSEGPKA